MISQDLIKAAFTLSVLRHHAPSRQRDLATASIHTIVGQRFGPAAILYVTYASYLVDDHYDRFIELGLEGILPAVDQLLEIVGGAYQREYVESETVIKVQEFLAQASEVLLTPDAVNSVSA